MASLSKLANCLSDQQLHHSPLMGHITNIVDQKLSTIDDARLVMSHIRSNAFTYKYLLLYILISDCVFSGS